MTIWTVKTRFGHSPGFRLSTALLPFVFALADLFKHGETGLFRVGDGQRLELVRRIEGGNDFAHRLFARRTMRQRLGRKRPAQREFPAAYLAVAFAQLVFVKRHGPMSNSKRQMSNWQTGSSIKQIVQSGVKL